VPFQSIRLPSKSGSTASTGLQKTARVCSDLIDTQLSFGGERVVE